MLEFVDRSFLPSTVEERFKPLIRDALEKSPDLIEALENHFPRIRIVLANKWQSRTESEWQETVLRDVNAWVQGLHTLGYVRASDLNDPEKGPTIYLNLDALFSCAFYPKQMLLIVNSLRKNDDVAGLEAILLKVQKALGKMKALITWKMYASILADVLKDVVRHELTHLVTFLRNEASAKQRIALIKLERQREKQETEFNRFINAAKQSKLPDDFKQYLWIFFKSEIVTYALKIYLEGIADFAAKLEKELKLFKPKEIEKRRDIALKLAKTNKLNSLAAIDKIFRSVEPYLKYTPTKDPARVTYDLILNQLAQTSTYSGYYEIGLHMAQVIALHSGNITSAWQFFDLNPMVFIQAYEKACAALNIEPVITWSSGKGVFDFSRETLAQQKVFESNWNKILQLLEAAVAKQK